MNALSDDYLFEVIVKGGAAVGKSPLMAPWGGTLSDDGVRDVIAFIRTLADPPYAPPSS
jgi:mono/diheme cytochrome c family protein